MAPGSSDGDFDERLARAKRRSGQDASDLEQPSLLGYAFRIGTELVVGVVVGGAIGWGLDRWLGTHFLLFAFLMIGIAAGFLNVFRGARAMNAELTKGPPAPGVPDDEDD